MESGGGLTTPLLQLEDPPSVPQQPETLDPKAMIQILAPATMESRGISTTPLLQLQKALDALTFPSQLFLQTPRTFLPFHQPTPPPLAEEWLHRLTNVSNSPDRRSQQFGNTAAGNPNQVARVMSDAPQQYPRTEKTQSAWGSHAPRTWLKSYPEAIARIP